MVECPELKKKQKTFSLVFLGWRRRENTQTKNFNKKILTKLRNIKLDVTGLKKEESDRYIEGYCYMDIYAIQATALTRASIKIKYNQL